MLAALSAILALAVQPAGGDEGRGKRTDVSWLTVVSPRAREKTGYPAQKPLRLLERIVRMHSRPGDRLLEFFAGSGSFGEAAWRPGRDAVRIDSEPQVIEAMARRQAATQPRIHGTAACAQDGA